MKIRVVTAIITSLFISALIILFFSSSLADAAEQKVLPLGISQEGKQSQVRLQNTSPDRIAYLDVAEKLSAEISEISTRLFSIVAAPILEADLSISKSANPDPVSVGQTLEYSITVDNAGPDRAQKVVVTDNLPSEVSYLASGGDCTLQGELICNLGNIKADESKTITVTVTVNSEGIGTINNTASVSSDSVEINPGNEQVTIGTSVNRSADLSISKSADPDPVAVGQSLTYLVTVDNKGPGAATNVVVTDTLPAEVSFSSVSAGCSNSGVVVCNLGTIASGSNKSVEIVVTLDSEGSGTIANTAVVSSDTPEENPGDESTTITTDTTTAPQTADLSISKSADPDPVAVGQLLTYLITVDNNGPASATNVEVTDTLPTEVSFSSASAGCSYSDNVVCSLGTIPAGSDKSVQIAVIVNSEGSGSIANTAVVSSDTPEENPGDESTTITTNTTPSQETADLSISKSADPNPVLVGQQLTYLITVDNNGPSTATNVVVTDTLPAEVSFSSASAGCSNAGSVVCSLGSIAAGTNKSVQIVVTVDSEGSGNIANTAVVGSDTPEANPGDESTTILTGTSEQADLTVSKSDSQDPAFVGQVITYTTVVENQGTLEAQDVVLVDTLPSEVSFVSASAGCALVGDVICDLGNLASGESKIVDIAVTIDSDLPSSIVNQADVSSSSSETNLINNHAEEVTIINVTGTADLVITKSDNLDPVIAGENLIYTINVENLGPDDASGVVVSDTLPAEVSFVSASAGCVMQDFVNCLLGTLRAGSSKEVTIEVAVDSTAPVVISNIAEVTSAATDEKQNNNKDVEETAVINRADLSVANFVSSGPVIAGEPLAYTIIVTNVGPSLARNVVINNSILPDFNYVSSPDCGLNGSSINCDMGDLDVGESKQTTIVGSINPDISGNLTAVSTVFSSAQDLFPSNNSSIAVDSVISVSDLVITKNASSPTIIPGTSMSYEIEVVNLGPSVAWQVAVSDTLPVGLTLVNSSTSQGPGCGTTNPITCDLGNLTVNQVVTVSLEVNVSPSVTDTVENTASVQSISIDPEIINNQDTEASPIGVSANLNIDIQDDQDPVTAGTSLEYTLLVGNAGPSDASDVVVTNDLPSGVTFKSVTNDSGGTCVGTSIVTCQFDSLVVGGEISIGIVVDVNPGRKSTLNNSATVQSAAGDPDEDDNSAEESTNVEAKVDLMIEISGQPDPVIAGETLTYTLQVTNKGPSLASDVEVSTTIPPDVELVDSQASQGSGCSGSSLVVCQLGNIDPSSDAYVILTTVVYTDHDGLIENSATVSSDQTDIVPANNDADESVIVVDRLFNIYMPMLTNGSLTGEPNDFCNEAYPIMVNRTYEFFAEDASDWYVFELPTNGNLRVELRKFAPLLGQIALYKGPNCASRDFIQNNGDTSASKTIDPPGQETAGQYYIFISNDGSMNNEEPYELELTFTP